MDSDLFRILVVEDEKGFRHAFRENLLRTELFKVNLAPNITRALHLIEENDFDAVTCDIRLPRNSEGLEVIQELYNRHKRSYVVALTAFETYRDSALAAGADVVLIKPHHPSMRIQTIEMGILQKSIMSLSSATKIPYKLLEPLADFGLESRTGLVGIVRSLDAIAKQSNHYWETINSIGVDRIHAEQALRRIVLTGLSVIANMPYVKTEHLNEVMRNIESVDDSRPSDHNSENSSDINLVAYKLKFDQLLDQHKGKYIAMIEGDLVLVDEDLSNLIKGVNESYPHKHAFIRLIEEQPQPIHIWRGPRLATET